MALTIGTLLSSQGADAHRHSPFGRIGGNPRYVTRSAAPGQTRPVTARVFPLGLRGPHEAAASRLGERSPDLAESRLSPGLVQSAARTNRTLVSPVRSRQIQDPIATG